MGSVFASFAAAQTGGSGARLHRRPAQIDQRHRHWNESKLALHCIGKHRTPTQPWLPAASPACLLECLLIKYPN